MPPNDAIKKLGKDAAFYGLGLLLHRAIVFLLFPLYTRVLTQSDFGVQGMMNGAVAIASCFLLLELGSGAARHYYDADQDDDRTRILSTWLWFEVALCVPACLLLIHLAEPICALAFGDAALAPVFKLAVAGLPFALIGRVPGITMRVTFQSRTYALICAARALVHAVAGILLVAVYGLGVKGVLLALLIANAFRMVAGLAATHRCYRLTFSLHWLRRMMAFSLPLVPAAISLWVLHWSNLYFLAHYTGQVDVGLMAAGSKISSVVFFVIAAFQTAWGPFAYSLAKDEELAKETYSKVLSYFLLLSLLVTVSISVFGREAICVLATPAYERAAHVVPWLCFSSVLWGCYYIVGMGFGIAMRSYHTTISIMLGALVNTACNVAFVPRFGLQGAAAAILVGHLPMVVYAYWKGQHYFHVRYEWRRVGAAAALALAAIAACSTIDRAIIDWRPSVLIGKSVVFALYVAGYFALRLVRMQDVLHLRRYVLSRCAAVFRRAPTSSQGSSDGPDTSA